MTPVSFIIVADRGGLKAYRVMETRTRGPSLRLLEDFALEGTEASLPGYAESRDHHVMLPSDWPALEKETDRRIWQQLAERLTEVISREKAEGFALAAHPAIHRRIIDLLPAFVRDRIVEHVPSDLMNVPPGKLHSHFRSLQTRHPASAG